MPYSAPDPGSGVTRITGPLRTWYDLHEAIAHEAEGLAAAARSLDATSLEAFAERFAAFDSELRTHSETEDGIVFPAIVEAGGHVPSDFREDHHHEQLLAYDAGWALLDAKVRPTPERLGALAELVARLGEELVAHLEAEDRLVLPQVQDLFGDDEQGALLRTIIGVLPPDPGLQPWIASALTPEHRETRLRNMAASLPREAFVGLLGQIRDGVDTDVWDDISSRTPEIAALVDGTDARA